MRTFLLSTVALAASPLTSFACDGSVRCAMRNAPRQMMQMLPGFFSSHLGLFAGLIVVAGLFYISSPRAGAVSIFKK